MLIYVALVNYTLQKNFSGSNTDGSFTTAVSNSFLSQSLGKNSLAADFDNLG